MPLEYAPIPEDLWDDWLWLVKAEGLQIEIREGPLRLGASQFALLVHYSVHIPKLVLQTAATGGWFDSEACRAMIELALISSPLNLIAGGNLGADTGLETHFAGESRHIKAAFGCLNDYSRVLAVIPAVGPAESVALEKGANNATSSALIMRSIGTMMERHMLQPALEGWVISYHGHRIAQIEPLEFLTCRCETMRLEPDVRPKLENVPDGWT